MMQYYPFLTMTSATPSPTLPHLVHPTFPASLHLLHSRTFHSRISYTAVFPTPPYFLHRRISYTSLAMSYTPAPTPSPSLHPLHLYTSASRHLLHTASPLYPFRNHLPALISRPSRLRLLLSRSGLRYA